MTSQISLKRIGLWPRSTSDRYAGGVLGGLAAATSTDVGLLRGATAGIALWVGASAPAVIPLGYLALWLVLPTPLDRSLVLRAFTRKGAQEITAAVLATLVVTVLSHEGNLVLLPVLGLAGWLLANTPITPAPNPTPSPDTGTEQPDSPTPPPHAPKPLRWGRALRSGQGQEVLVPGIGDEPGSSFRAQRREPALWPLAASGLMLWLVGCITADRTLDSGLAPGVIVSGAIVIVGAVLTLSAWRGRAGIVWLSLPPLLLLWFAFSVHNIPRNEIDGTQVLRPTELVDGETLSVSGGYGEITVDLRGLDLGAGEEVNLEVSQTAGNVLVRYPASYRVRGRASVGLGLVAFDYEQTPLVADSETLNDYHPDDWPTIKLTADAGLSSISILPDQEYRS